MNRKLKNHEKSVKTALKQFFSKRRKKRKNIKKWSASVYDERGLTIIQGVGGVKSLQPTAKTPHPKTRVFLHGFREIKEKE